MSPELSLPDTGLIVDGGELIRKSSEGEVVMRLPLDSVHRLSVSRRPSLFGLILFASALAVGYLAFEIAESNALRVCLCLLAIIVLAFGILAARETILTMHIGTEKQQIDCSDSHDVVSGFVTSFNRSKQTPTV